MLGIHVEFLWYHHVTLYVVAPWQEPVAERLVKADLNGILCIVIVFVVVIIVVVIVVVIVVCIVVVVVRVCIVSVVSAKNCD